MTFKEFKEEHKGIFIKWCYVEDSSLYLNCDDMEVVDWEHPLGGAYIVYLREVERRKDET